MVNIIDEMVKRQLALPVFGYEPMTPEQQESVLPGFEEFAREFTPGSGDIQDIRYSHELGTTGTQKLFGGDILGGLGDYGLSMIAAAGVLPVIGDLPKLARMGGDRLVKALPDISYKATKELLTSEKKLKPLSARKLTTVSELPEAGKIQTPFFEKIASKTNPKRKISVPHHSLGSPSKKFLKNIQNRTAREETTGALRKNEKTGLSIDFSSDCARRHGDIGPCPYCYVEHSRTSKKLGYGFMTTRVGEYPYENDILYMPKQIVDKLNNDGGLRMFSLGDYRPDKDFENVARVLDDASKRGLYVKAITKEKALIDTWGDHPNFRANISVDGLPSNMTNAPTIEEAMKWKAGRENIKIRAVAMNEEQLHRFAKDPRISIVTRYHGITDENKLIKMIKNQNPGLIDKVGEDAVRAEIRTWGKFKTTKKQQWEKYPDKMCCQSGKCAGDKTKCGFGLMGLGMIIPGVMIPESENAEN